MPRSSVAWFERPFSALRFDATPESDVAVLADSDPAANIGVYEYVALTRFLGELFPARVDVANHATQDLVAILDMVAAERGTDPG